MSSLKQHFAQHKNAYLAGGGALAALIAGYWLFKNKAPAKPRPNYFPKEYYAEAGVSKELSRMLGKAFAGGVDYDLKLWIQPHQNRFKGVAEIGFLLNPDFTEDLYLSIQGLKVYQIRINGKKVDPNYFAEITETQPGALYFANRHLTKENFKLTIKYSGEFAQAYGLIHYQDPRSDSGESYVFSSTGILGASSIYPVFESPEVRCLFRLAVAVPKEWTPLSNEKSEDPVQLSNEFGREIYEGDPNKEDFHIFRFRQTKSIPFYALNIAAGKFAELKTKSAVMGRKVSVYSVASGRPVVERVSEHIGKIVKSTVARMEKLTGVKFPFTKCDFLVLPEELIFPAIFALNPIKVNKEYPGLSNIYLRDYYNFKAEFVFEVVTSIIRLWFGNLVSVEWWSQLWLTEAFSRYLALKLLSEEPKDFDLEDEDVYYLSFWLKSQAVYHETQNDVTATNTSLIQDDVVNSYDALFLAQNKAEKVGPFKLEELFSLYSEDVFTKVLAGLLKDNAYKAISYMDFEVAFMAEVGGDPEKYHNLKGCFNYQFVDDVKFSRTDARTLTVQRITKDQSDASKNHLVELVFLTRGGQFVKRETVVLKDTPVRFELDSEVYTFLSVMKNNGIYYEDYEAEELARIFEVLHDNKQLELEFRMKAGRILLTNTLRNKQLKLADALGHLKTLLASAGNTEQRWLVRSFAVIAKHIDRTRESAQHLQDFCSFLVGLARHNAELVPYLGFFGVFDAECKDEVCNFTEDYLKAASFDPATSLLNYDLLKSAILMIAFLRLDLDRASLFHRLVSTRDPATGAILHRLVDSHFEDLGSEHLKIEQDLKTLFSARPTYDNALEYYFKALLVRTEKSPEIKTVKEFLRRSLDEQDDHFVGSRKSFVHYNVSKIMSSAAREEEVVDSEMDLSPGVDAMLSRRFKHHFRLS